MARLQPWFVRSAPRQGLIGGGLHGALPEPASAGPLVCPSAAAQQTYAKGLQKLTGMFGSHPCPTVKPPQ